MVKRFTAGGVDILTNFGLRGVGFGVRSIPSTPIPAFVNIEKMKEHYIINYLVKCT